MASGASTLIHSDHTFITSSPLYPKSNGFIECQIKTIKTSLCCQGCVLRRCVQVVSNMMTTKSSPDRPATHTHSKTFTSPDTIPPVDVKSTLNTDIADHKDTLQVMQKTDPFCKCISKWLLNGKAPFHEVDTFTHIKGLLYKHVKDSNQNC